MIAAVVADGPVPIPVTTFVDRYGTASRPAVLQDAKGQPYVVKALQPGRPGDQAEKHARSIVNDAVLGCVAQCMGAPTPPTVLIDVSQELIDLQPALHDEPQFRFAPGIAHGSIWVTQKLGGREGNVAHLTADNHERHALLALLYGWIAMGDFQFYYEDDPPNLVHSVDHGLALVPHCDSWTVDKMHTIAAPEPHPQVAGPCSFTDDDLRPYVDALRGVTDEQVAAAVGTPPDSWGISMDERVALAEFLAKRRDVLIERLS